MMLRHYKSVIFRFFFAYILVDVTSQSEDVIAVKIAASALFQRGSLIN